MREIISDTNSPTYNIAKRLIREMQKIGSIYKSTTVRNTAEEHIEDDLSYIRCKDTIS